MTAPSSAERMRLARDRKRRGEVLAPLFVTGWGVERLTAMGLLHPASAADPAAIRAAAQFLLGAALAGGDALARDALERLRRDSGSG